MFRISKRFEFSASHQLSHLPEGHPCARLHGHNYKVELVLEGEPDARGFVQDYGELEPFKRWIDETLDHRHLNDAMGASVYATAEMLARLIFRQWTKRYPLLAGVRVSETDKTWAEYWP